MDSPIKAQTFLNLWLICKFELFALFKCKNLLYLFNTLKENKPLNIFSNRDRFTALYDKAETLFEQLIDFQEAWRPFVILGCVNLEDLCEVYLKTRDDWDKNFKACKQFSQQIAKIPGYTRNSFIYSQLFEFHTIL